MKTIKAAIATFKQTQADLHYEAVHLDDETGRYLNQRIFLRAVRVETLGRLMYRVNVLVCKQRGHKIEVEGHAGPESGYEDFYCKRCGWSDHHTYY